MKKLPIRKSPRLKGYDYTTSGIYFITICTHNKKHLLSKINVGQGLAPAENNLSVYGLIVKRQIELLEIRYKGLKIEKYVIMPNHIHILLSTIDISLEENLDTTDGASPIPTVSVSDIICTFKSLTTRMCKQNGLNDKRLFQTSFHDHIIRSEKDYKNIWEYIDTNVVRWENDCYF